MFDQSVNAGIAEFDYSLFFSSDKWRSLDLGFYEDAVKPDS